MAAISEDVEMAEEPKVAIPEPQQQPGFFAKAANFMGFGGDKKKKVVKRSSNSSSDEDMDEERYM